MAVTLRLTRCGGKKSPHYRVVAADERSPRDGRLIEQIGIYDPRQNLWSGSERNGRPAHQEGSARRRGGPGQGVIS